MLVIDPEAGQRLPQGRACCAPPLQCTFCVPIDEPALVRYTYILRHFVVLCAKQK